MDAETKAAMLAELAGIITETAGRWLLETWHRAGCQCHKCVWAHGVIAGRITLTFGEWERRA